MKPIAASLRSTLEVAQIDCPTKHPIFTMMIPDRTSTANSPVRGHKRRCGSPLTRHTIDEFADHPPKRAEFRTVQYVQHNDKAVAPLLRCFDVAADGQSSVL